MKSPVSNMKVAETLGVHNSMVSRIRSGDRFPSLALMRKIEEIFRWKLSSQARVVGSPEYATKFEEVLNHHYGGLA